MYYLFFFNDTATTEIYTLSLHDALPISWNAKYTAEAVSHEVGHNLGLHHDGTAAEGYYGGHNAWAPIMGVGYSRPISQRSEEHTSELQSRQYLVCRLLLEKKKIHSTSST